MGFKNILWQGSSLKQDASNRLVTDKEKTIWNNKANNSHTHAKSDIKDFPSSLPASDVYAWAKASSKPSYSWSEITNKPSTFNPSSHNHDSSYIPFSGSIVSNPNTATFSISKALSGYLLFANTGDTNGVAAGIGGVNGANDGWSVRGYQTTNNKGCLEISVGDDGDEGIYVRQYTSANYKLPFMNKAGSASGLNYREIVLMEPNTGNSIFPGTVTAKTFKGTLSGNASSASSVAWSGVTGKPSTFTPSAHTHNYAGSSSVGGSANSAVKLDTSTAGSATQPVYFSGGKPVACSYTLGKSVPSNAVFTDTDTWRPLGTTANTACAGNDSRLSNSRPASDVYSWAKAKSKPSYSWSEIGSKPSTFTPSSHNHDYLTLYGGRPANINFNTSTNGTGAMFHFVATSSTTTGKPPEDSNVLQLNWDNNGGYDSQLSITNCDGHMYFRGQSAGKWNNWKTVIDSSNIGSQSVNYANSAGGVAWGNISGKPSTFTPSSHTHTKSQVGLGNVDNTADSAKSVKYATSAGSTSNVIDVGAGSDNKSRHVWFSNTNPETSRVYSDKFQYNPATDVLTVGSITGSASSAASVPWSGVTGKPSTFTPSSHAHNYAGSNSAGGAANYVAAGPASVTSEAYRHVWFSDAGTETARCYNDSFKYDPKSNKLTVNISGSANSVPWSGVTGKPSTFPPSSHSHSYVPLSGGTMTGTLSLKNTGFQIISNLPEDFSGTARGDRQVLWYSRIFEDDSYKYEDYCTHYINLGTPNSGTGNGKFGANVQVRFYQESSNYYTNIHSNSIKSNISVSLPLNSGTLQVSSSDVKLKTNVKDTEVDNAISFINKIHLHSFDWKTDDTHQSIGFIADELEELDERLSVGGNSDKVDENGLPIDPKCVNTFYLQGYEVKAIQELSSKVDTLEKENDKLKDIINQLFEKVTRLEK